MNHYALFSPFSFRSPMAFSVITRCSSALSLRRSSSPVPVVPQNRVAFRFDHNRLKPISIRASTSISATSIAEGVVPAISVTDDALEHLNRMRSERTEDLCLRIGVKQGGCSGMSYTMDFESRANTRPDDSIIEYNGFVIVCDPKSLLFLFGMQLDYSNALIGGGFSFKNPNATQTCGCGKSFNAEM